MARLGWAFLLVGLASILLVERRVEINPDLFMAATFGVFHLIYAGCTWPRKTADAGAIEMP
jgi:ABC-type iron transport system FetAB permease component